MTHHFHHIESLSLSCNNSSIAYWDGESIKLLSPEDKEKINSVSNDWANTSDVIALAYPLLHRSQSISSLLSFTNRYKPIDMRLSWIFANANPLNPVLIHLKKSESVEDIISIDEGGYTKPRSRKHKRRTFLRNTAPNITSSPMVSNKNQLRHNDSQNDLASMAEYSDNTAVERGMIQWSLFSNLCPASPLLIWYLEESLRQLQKNQIFIGMVALRDNPQGNLPKAVTSWRDAGDFSQILSMMLKSIQEFDSFSFLLKHTTHLASYSLLKSG